MIIVVIVSILGISGSRISLLGEYSARNDRDYQMAFQSAEAALHDAMNDMEGPGTNSRAHLFVPGNKVDFLQGCGTSGASKGLCAQEISEDTSVKPVWLQIDLASSTSPAATFGEFTGREFPSGSTGARPAQAPRYVIEVIDDRYRIGTDKSIPPKNMVYRATALGFGPRADAQAVVQMLYSKE